MLILIRFGKNMKKKLITQYKKIRLILNRLVNLLFRGVFFSKVILNLKDEINQNWIYRLVGENKKYQILKIKSKSRLVSMGYIEFNDSSIILTKDLEKMDLKYSDSEEIKFFINYFHLLGNLESSRSLSYKYIEMLSNQSKTYRLSNQQISELSQLSIWGILDVDVGQLIKNSVNFSNIFRNFKYHLLFDINLYSGSKYYTNTIFTKEDIDFGAYLKEKTNAIVGPKLDPNSDDNIFAEINKFDIVIVPSYIKSNFQNSKLRINVSYYNYHNQNAIINLFPSNVDGLDYAILKGNNINIKNYQHDVRFREALMSPFPWVIGNPNMTQIILYDLLHFETNRIKIFGIDFFAGASTYFEGYPSKIDHHVRLSYAEHNLLANIKFMKYLYYLEHYEIDDIAYKVLTMDEEEYISIIKNNYYS
jgi:hypothetical protein